MAASSSSGSSFTSSSLGRPPTYSRSYISPVDSTWTPTSGVSTASAPSLGGSFVPHSGLRSLDIGPPGYQATMYVHLKLCISPSNNSESSSRTHQTSALSISALGRWWGRSSAACYGNVAIRMKFWSITVRLYRRLYYRNANTYSAVQCAVRHLPSHAPFTAPAISRSVRHGTICDICRAASHPIYDK
jgi:hypothetical protein